MLNNTNSQMMVAAMGVGGGGLHDVHGNMAANLLSNHRQANHHHFLQMPDTTTTQQLIKLETIDDMDQIVDDQRRYVVYTE